MKKALLKASTHWEKKRSPRPALSLGVIAISATPRPSDAYSRPCWQSPDFYAPIILDTSPRNWPVKGSTHSVHPRYTLGPRAVPTKAAQLHSGFQDHKCQGPDPLRGEEDVFSPAPGCGAL